jgi:predicted nucleic acid-binding Zn ribbon protein
MSDRLPDQECVICGKRVASNHPRHLTCSLDCRRVYTARRRRTYRQAIREENAPIVVDPSVIRRCSDCGGRLSAYNRGQYCHSCWKRYSVRVRVWKGGDR